MKNPLVYLFNRMWHHSKGNHGRVVFYISLSLVANLLIALEPIVVGVFLNTVQTMGISNGTLPRLIFILSLLVILEVLFWAAHGPSRIIEAKNAFLVRANYKDYLLKGTMALPMEWHADHHSGDTIDKIEKGTNALFSFSDRTFEVIQGVVTLLTAFVAMLYFDSLSGAIAFVITIATFYALTLFDKKLVPGYRKVSRMENAASAKVFDALSNVTTVIILRVESLVQKSINLAIAKPYRQYTKNSRTNELKWFSASVFGRIAVVVIVGIYLYSHISTGGILAGTVYILYGYANQIRDTFFKFAYLYNDVVRYRAAVSNTEELSNDFKEVIARQKETLPKGWSAISIEGLSFSYHAEDGADLHLDNLALSIRRGERIALIGESGGGKTTLLKVMRDLYHPKSLTLGIDGAHYDGGFGSISDSISLIPQDPEVFASTVRENITLGVDYSDEHLKYFTDMACFTNVATSLPNGLESSIVEKGVNLSGGEKQRLALARGLLASEDKDIVLLDEPTSSVDFETELKIYRNIFAEYPEKTIVSSIHRLHLLSLFDNIYLFKDAKVVAHGSFEQLKSSSPDFKEQWNKYIKTRDAGTADK